MSLLKKPKRQVALIYNDDALGLYTKFLQEIEKRRKLELEEKRNELENVEREISEMEKRIQGYQNEIRQVRTKNKNEKFNPRTTGCDLTQQSVFSLFDYVYALT